MNKADLIFLAACILAAGPENLAAHADKPKQLYRRDSVARDEFKLAIATAEWLYKVYLGESL